MIFWQCNEMYSSGNVSLSMYYLNYSMFCQVSIFFNLLNTTAVHSYSNVMSCKRISKANLK